MGDIWDNFFVLKYFVGFVSGKDGDNTQSTGINFKII